MGLRIPLYLGLLASLAVFPDGLPWALLGWILAFGTALLRGGPARLIGAVPLLVVFIRRPEASAAMAALLLLLAAAAGAAAPLGRHRRWAAGAVAALLLSGGLLVWDARDVVHTRRHPPLDPARPIVCIGDSLTAWAYPRELAKLVKAPVVDHGVGGTTAAQGLEALGRTLELRPQAVLIEFGGHDYLRGRGREETRAALDAMIRRCRDAGAEVILFEVPRGFIHDGFGGLERGLARAHDLELIPDGAIRWLVLRSPWFPVRLGEPLSDDGLHPNAAGSLHLAQAAADALSRVFR
jgi:acyl-CoA thioesterase I